MLLTLILVVVALAAVYWLALRNASVVVRALTLWAIGLLAAAVVVIALYRLVLHTGAPGILETVLPPRT